MDNSKAEANIDARSLVNALLIGVALCVFLAVLFLPAWMSQTRFRTYTAYHSLLAFLSMVCVGMMLARSRGKSADWDVVSPNPFLYSAIYNLMSACYIILSEHSGAGLAEDELAVHTVYMAVFGVLALTNAILRWRRFDARHAVPVSLAMLSLALVATAVLVSGIYRLPEDIVAQLTTELSIVTAVTLNVSGIVYLRIRLDSAELDASLMLAGSLIFGASWIPMFISAVFPSSIWTLVFPLQAVGLVILTLSVALPHMTQTGWKRTSAIKFTLGFSVVGVLPVVVAVVGDAMFPGFLFQTPDGFALIHAGAAVLSSGMAFLVISYNRERFSPTRQAIAFLFVSWSAVEVFYVLQSIFSGPAGALQTTPVPYIIGNLLTLGMLVLAVRWTKMPPRAENQNLFRVMVVSAVPVTVLLSILGVFAERNLEAAIPGFAVGPSGKAIMLTTIVAVVFLYVYLESMFAAKTKGRVSIDLLANRFLALWIIPQLLKSNYDEWSLGWWVAELMLFAALLIGPAVLGHFYIKEINRAERSQKMATLYADLLMHDMSNYHQALALCLGLLEMEDISAEQKERTLRDANVDLVLADQLVRNVRRMGMIEQVDKRSFHPVDIVATVEGAFEAVSRSPEAEGFFLTVTRERGECFVLANPLLTDVFLNLFANSIQYSVEDRSIVVDIAGVSWNGADAWQVSITDRGKGIEPELKSRLFQRYMEGAGNTGLGLSVVKALVDIFSGHIEVRDRVDGDHTKGTVFVITVPACAANG